MCCNRIRLMLSAHQGELAAQVVVPGTYMEYTSRRVLTSTWIEGEKLSQSKADNVAELVNVGVVAYLHQLLDIGALLPLFAILALKLHSLRMFRVHAQELFTPEGPMA